MQKPIIGRGLGTLLGDQKVVGTDTEPTTPMPETPLGSGVRSLLRGSAQAPDAAINPAEKPPLIPRWYFFAADILLVALGVMIAFRSRTPLDWKQMVVCIGSIVAGGCCGIAGALMGRSKKSDSPFRSDD